MFCKVLEIFFSVFQCQKCDSIFIGHDLTIKHIKLCYKLCDFNCDCLNDLEKYVIFMNNKFFYEFIYFKVYLLFESTKNFSFARISCALCRTTHCSIIALRKHYALTHSKFIRFEKNNCK